MGFDITSFLMGKAAGGGGGGGGAAFCLVKTERTPEAQDITVTAKEAE